MEPTIYKPSIYKGAGIYKAGAGGGGGSSGKATIGGRTYKTATIGTQTWMAENLDYKFSGCVIGASGFSDSEPRGNYYNDDEATYGYGGTRGQAGLLYNWPAAKYLNDNKSSLIPGWHVPSADEWNTLATFVGVGFNLKKGPGNVWGFPWNGGEITDFSAYPCGCKTPDGYRNLGDFIIFWALDEYSGSNGRRLGLDRTNLILQFNDPKDRQFSLRLIKD